MLNYDFEENALRRQLLLMKEPMNRKMRHFLRVVALMVSVITLKSQVGRTAVKAAQLARSVIISVFVDNYERFHAEQSEYM